MHPVWKIYLNVFGIANLIVTGGIKISYFPSCDAYFDFTRESVRSEIAKPQLIQKKQTKITRTAKIGF